MAYNPVYRNSSAILTQLAVGGSFVASAILSLSSTTQGFLLPGMSTAQINAISSPALGLQAFNTDTAFPNFWNGTSWIPVGTSAILPSTVGAIPVFSNTTGGLENTGVLIAPNSNIFWALDGTSSIGQTAFESFKPNSAPIALAADVAGTVYVGGSFSSVGYIPLDLSNVAILDNSGNVLEVNGVPWMLSSVPIASFFTDTVRNRLYITSTTLATEFLWGAANGGNNQTFGIIVLDLSTQAFLSTWTNFGLGGGSFPSPTPAAGAQWVDAANDFWYLWNPSGGYNNIATGNIIRVNSSTGNIDNTYNAALNNFDGPVNAMFQDPTSGFMVVVGSFTHFGATAVSGICRLDTTGVIDPTFNPLGAGFVGGAANAIYISPSGYYVGGAFTTYNGTTVNGLVRLAAADGSIDGAFPNGVNITGGAPGVVNTIAYDPTGNPNTFGPAIWFGGNFNIYNGFTTYGNLLFLDESGVNLFPALGGGQAAQVNGPVNRIAIPNNFSGNTYIAGPFTTFTDIVGTVTTVENFAETNEYDGNYHPFGAAPQLSRPKDIYASERMQVGGTAAGDPFGGIGFYVQTSGSNTPGFYGEVNNPTNSDPVGFYSFKSRGLPSVFSDVQGEGENLNFYDVYGYSVTPSPSPTGTYEPFGGMRVYSDQGQGARIEWYTQKNSTNRVMWLDSKQCLNMRGEIQWQLDGFGDIGRLNASYLNSVTLNGLQFTTVVGSSAALNPQYITVVFANDGTAGAETVTITGTFPPVQASSPVTVTVHMQSGVSQIWQIAKALNTNATVTNNLFNTYFLGRTNDTVASGSATFSPPNPQRPGSVHAKNAMSIGGEAYHTQQLGGNTTNNTQLRLLDVNLDYADQIMLVEARVTARRTGGTGGTNGDAGYFIIRAICKNIGGVATVVQTYNDSYSDNVLLSVDIISTGPSAYTNGQGFSVAVTGDTNNNYNWGGTVITQVQI